MESSTDFTADSAQINPAHFSLIHLLPVAVYTCDKEGRITFYNEAAANLWGRRPEIGKDIWCCGSWEVFDADASPIAPENGTMDLTLGEGDAVTGTEILVKRPDGKRIPVRPHPEPIFDGNGNLIGTINMLVDISDEKAREKVLREKEDRYRHLSESLEKTVETRTSTLKKSEERYHKMVDEVQDYAILLLDLDGNIVNWNKGAENIKGYTDKEVIGKNFSIFYLEEDRKTQLPQSLINEARENGRAMHEGYRLRKDGTKFWGYIVITALHDDSGNVIGFSKVTRDLTERKIAEDQLKNFAHDIEIRNKQLEEYAYIASHDLQEPIRKIQLFSEMLKDDIDNKAAVLKNLDKINQSAKRMSDLVKDVLSYSQLSQTDGLKSETDLDMVLQNVKDDLDLFIAERGATIIQSGMPKIHAIPIQIHQLFFNLIANAIKFSTENPIVEIISKTFTANALEHPELTEGHQYVAITFKDNGIGFEQQYANQAFKMFQRLNHSHSGTGIGLALCKKIVENHNGRISVDSKIGTGTTFHIFLKAD